MAGRTIRVREKDDGGDGPAPGAYHPRMTDLDPRSLHALIGAMPKAELHLHLDGSLRVETALDIARTRGLDAPRTYAGMRGVLVGPARSEDQAQLLLAFDLPIALMQDVEAIERTAADLVEDKAFDNVRYVEIRWAPLLHTARGLSGRKVVEAVSRGAVEAGRRHGVEVRLIATLMRSHEPDANLALVRDLEVSGIPDGLVAVDVAGQEARFPDPRASPRRPRPCPGIGLHVTLHAGEWGGAAQVRRALALDPDRIAHGPLAIDDPDARAGADRPRHLAGPLPHVERAGQHRPVASRRTPFGG